MEKDIDTLIQEIPFCDPLFIFKALYQEKWAILLDSALRHAHYGRYSYIAIEPFKTLEVKNGKFLIDDVALLSDENPFMVLKKLLKPYSLPFIPDLPPFQGGALGTFSYDLYQYLETISAHALDEMNFPDMAIGIYDLVLAFDHFQEKAWIISTGMPETKTFERRRRAAERIKHIEKMIQSCTKKRIKKHGLRFSEMPVTSNFTKDGYIQAVKKIKDHILAGDIFQANVSQCFQGILHEDFCAWDLYQQLRQHNPAPFAAFLNLGHTTVLSASPERFLQMNEGKVETRPIKGTRARSLDLMEDLQNRDALKSSEKDRAENMMIVDLMRNDLSKVCKEHSVVVTQLCELESYATVHHLVSVVQGELKSNHEAIDLLLATFPGGSVTGAPKIRAMEIIAQIEPSNRGLYCGSIGFIGFNGAMDSSIVIRTYIIQNNVVRFQSGGAVVLDSNPEDEYQESLLKSSVLSNLLKGCYGFID